MDTAGLLGKGRIAKMSRELLELGLVDLFASDNHGDSRSLATARAWLLEVATPEHADLLTKTNAGRLLAGEGGRTGGEFSIGRRSTCQNFGGKPGGKGDESLPPGGLGRHLVTPSGTGSGWRPASATRRGWTGRAGARS